MEYADWYGFPLDWISLGFYLYVVGDPNFSSSDCWMVTVVYWCPAEAKQNS